MHSAPSVRHASRSLPAPAQYLCGLTWDGTRLWHSDQGAGTIYAIDRTDGTVLREFRCPYVRADLAFDGSFLCQVGGRPKRIVLVDRTSGEVVGNREVLPASGRLTGIELGPEGMWMCLRLPMVVQLRDYPALTVRREYEVPLSAPSGLTYAHGIVVVGDFEQGTIHAVDAATGRHLGSTSVRGRPTGLTWDGERVWYCDFPNRCFRTVELDAVLG